MLTYLLNHVGSPGTSGFVPTALPSFSEEQVPGYTYQPPEARALLRAAGYSPRPPLEPAPEHGGRAQGNRRIPAETLGRCGRAGADRHQPVGRPAGTGGQRPGGLFRQQLAGRLPRRGKLPGPVLQPQFQPRRPRQNPLHKRRLRPALRPSPPRPRTRPGARLSTRPWTALWWRNAQLSACITTK